MKIYNADPKLHNLGNVHQSREGGRVKTRYHVIFFFLNSLNFDFVEFILAATRTLIIVEQSTYSFRNKKMCDLQDSFQDILYIQHTSTAKSLNRSEFQYFVMNLKKSIVCRCQKHLFPQ